MPNQHQASKAEATREWRARMKANGWVEVKSWVPPALAEKLNEIIDNERPDPPRAAGRKRVRRGNRAGQDGTAKPPRFTFLGPRAADNLDEEDE